MIDARSLGLLAELLQEFESKLVSWTQDERHDFNWIEADAAYLPDGASFLSAACNYTGRMEAVRRLLDAAVKTQKCDVPLLALSLVELVEAGGRLNATIARAAILASVTGGRAAPVVMASRATPPASAA